MLKFVTTVFVLVVFANSLAAQHSACDTLFTVVDEMPTFGNERSDFLEYMGKNLKLKKPCNPNELRQIAWTINRTGKMVDVEVMGIDGECKRNLIQQLETFPLWTPGKLKGKSVCVQMILPIHIRQSD